MLKRLASAGDSSVEVAPEDAMPLQRSPYKPDFQPQFLALKLNDCLSDATRACTAGYLVAIMQQLIR